MGARESRTRITNRSVYYKYKPTLVDYIDLRFNHSFKTLLKIEIIRCKFILVWNELLHQTGAVVLKNAKFFYILEALMLNLGVMMKERVSSVKLLTEDPYISFEPEVRTTPDMLRLIESYIKLLIFARENERDIYDLNDEINLSLIEIEEILRDDDDILRRGNVALIKSLGIKAKMRQNHLRVKQGQAVICTIKTVVEDLRRSLPDFIHKFYHGDEMLKIDLMIEDAKYKRVNTSPRLVHKYIKQPKLVSFEDHYDAIEKDKKSENEAKVILAAYYGEFDLNKVAIYPSRTEPNISNIVQTISKEEPILYRSVTEPREGFVTRQIPIGGITRSVEPRSGVYYREKPVEYNRTITEPRPDIRRELDEIEHRMQPRFSDVRREREPIAIIERPKEERRMVETVKPVKMVAVQETNKPSFNERLKEKISEFPHSDKDNDRDFDYRDRDMERGTDLLFRDKDKQLIRERDSNLRLNEKDLKMIDRDRELRYRDADLDRDRDFLYRDTDRDRDRDRDLIRERDSKIRDREYERDSDKERERVLVYMDKDKDFNREKDLKRQVPEEDLRYMESSRTREIPVVPVVLTSSTQGPSVHKEFNKPNSERVFEFRNEKEFPKDHYIEEPVRLRTLQEPETVKLQNGRLSDLRRDREFPGDLSKSTVEKISDVRRERENQGELIKPKEELRFYEAGKGNNILVQSQAVTSDANYNNYDNSYIIKPASTERLTDVRRERIGNEKEEIKNRSAVPIELRRERDLDVDKEKRNTEKRTNEIRKEIAEIERKISEQRLNDIRREREFHRELEKNKSDYKLKEEGTTPGITEYITTRTVKKAKDSDTSDMRREDEYDYKRDLDEREESDYKKKKYKKKKHKYEDKENIDVNKPIEVIPINDSKIMMTEDKNIIPAYLPSKEPFRSSNIKEIRGNTSSGMGREREEYRGEEKLRF